MRRCQVDSWLRILDEGVPFDGGTVVIHAHATGDLLFVGGPDASLRYGPFLGAESVIDVASMSMNLAVSAPSTEADPHQYQVELGSSFGAIRIQCAEGQLLPLQCITRSRITIDPTYMDGHLCRFDRLAEGTYIVVPRLVFERTSVADVDFEGSSVSVNAGQVSSVQCNPAWLASGPIEGRLVLSSGVEPPSLLPAFGTPLGPVIDAGRWNGYPVLADGSFALPAGGPMPSALIAFDRWAGHLRVRGVIGPTGTQVLDEVTLVLCRGRRDSSSTVLDVQYECPRGWTHIPVHESVRRVDFEVELEDVPIRIPIPRGLTEVGLRRRADGQTRKIDLGSTASSTIDIDQLFSSGEGQR